MNGIREYLITVLSASIISAIVIHITGKNQLYSSIIKLVTAVFLSVCLVGPLLKLELQDISEHINSIDTDAQSIVSDVNDSVKKETELIIIERTQAYIEDKAALYGAEINASVTITNPESFVPDLVVLKGSISPYGKRALSQIIKDDLGIPEENQTWI